MTRIRANRESIDDRFSVLGFTVNADQPLYEIGLATDPDLFKPENRTRRTAGNFYATPLQGARPRTDAVYLVPPAVVARFVGQPRLYFGVATYADKDRNKPITVRRPDSGHMYVSLRGLTERGFRRGARNSNGNGTNYGAPAAAPAWGGDALPDAPSATPTQTPNASTAAPASPTPYSDGYSDELWRQAPGSAAASSPPATASTAPAPPAPMPPSTPATPAATAAPTATSQGIRTNGSGQSYTRGGASPYGGMQGADYDDGFGPMPTHRSQPTRTGGMPAARAMRVVSSYYNPSDWMDALRTQIGFFAASVQWWAGVENTTVMPHSAICQARRADGSADGTQHGTAFFIAPNLLLTAAHVVDGQSELIIVPGKNGAGGAGANEPFGRFRVSAADMVKHPSYVSSSRDFDMALIRVPAANASSNYFDLVEELTQSRPEGVVVSGYAAYSDPQGIIDSVVNATIDADKQHLHGGYIRSLPTDETFDYDLQSLGGTSGSPVYYIENGDAPRMHMVGVHVAGASDTTNLGCRVTPAKLAWIRQQAAAWSQALTFSLGARALSDDSASNDDASFDDVDTYSHESEPVEAEFAEAQSLRGRTRTLSAPTPDYPGASRFAPAHARNFHTGRRRGAVIDRIVIHITAGGPNINGTISWFQDGERRDPNTGVQAGPSSAHYIVGRDGEVVQMVRNADTAYHASSANSRSIGIEHNANKPYRLNRRDLPPTMEQYEASAHLVAWLASQYGIPLDREHIVGHSEATPADQHDCPSSYWDWDTYMQCVQLAAQALAQNSSTGAVPATSQGLRGRAAVRAYSVDPAQFSWPSGLADPGQYIQAFTSEYNQRLADGATGAPAPDPTQYSSSENADSRARARTRHDILDRMGRDLQDPTDRMLLQRDLLSLATAVAMQVLDLVADRMPPTPYAQLFTDANQVPAPSRDFTVPTALPMISRRIGTFLAWIDAATQMAHTDVAERIAAHRQQWDEMNAMIGATGTMLSLAPGLGEAVTIVQLVVQAVVQAATPDFDRPQTDLNAAMSTIRHAYRDLASSLLRGLILSRYPNAQYTNFPLQSSLESLIEEHAAHALRGWQDELRFLGVGLDTIAQSLGSKPPPRARGVSSSPVRAQELITPYYDPSNPASALQCTNDAFSQQREEWYVGVENTSAFPHSAICYLEMTKPNGDVFTGTGFYIGPNRILTCAHNLYQKASVRIIPGHNGVGSTPFGEGTMTSSQWRLAPNYTGSGDWDHDLAVIDNVPISAPNGAYFKFLNATPSMNMPLAVCGYSGSSNLHPELRDVTDSDKQHLHGGHAQGQATPDTIDYDILAIAGASGSPVYTVRDEGGGLEAFVCGVHVTRGPINASTGGASVNRACFITPTKIDWIEGRATTFACRGSRAMSADTVEHRVTLVPQPDKNACWAASMAMLKSFRSDASFDPEAFVHEAGGSLATSYGWDQLERVRDHYGFRVIEQPSNASLYHTPTQWAQWLRDFGPLWVVIVGAPHAVVVSGIRGDLNDPAATELYVLNPWDTTTAFDNDPVAFNPPNRGFEGWMSFDSFAADFGNMAEPDYGNWRVLHLPAAAAQAQSLGAGRTYRLAAAPLGRSLSDDGAQPIEPTRVAGTRMSVVRGNAGASRWALDQLDGRKAPQSPVSAVSSLQPTDVVIDLGEWPALEGQSAPLPLTVRFRSEADGSIGNVVISAGAPAQLGYGVDVVARIDDAPDADGVAALRVGIDVRFSGLAQGAPCARIDLRLLGNGRYERSNRWTDTSLAA
ncbi:N-acetylmuramoyl-L-alanine amidase [Lysobacter sp. HA35]